MISIENIAIMPMHAILIALILTLCDTDITGIMDICDAAIFGIIAMILMLYDTGIDWDYGYDAYAL